MEKSLYENLTTEEKIGLLHYERGATGLVQHSHYDSLKVNPEPTPSPRHIYISNVLDIDFKEFYDSKESQDKSIIFKEELKDLAIPIGPDGDKSWSIGDVLADVLYIMTHPDEKHLIDEVLVENIDRELLRIYNGFMDLGVNYELIPNLMHEGKPVYRRV